MIVHTIHNTTEYNTDDSAHNTQYNIILMIVHTIHNTLEYNTDDSAHNPQYNRI